MESLDVLLGDQGVSPQLQVGTAGLAGEHVSLTFHEGVLDFCRKSKRKDWAYLRTFCAKCML